jgi:CRISPR-associated endonuclease Cas2
MTYTNKYKRDMTKHLLLSVYKTGSLVVDLTKEIHNDFFRHYIENGKIDYERLAYRLNRLERDDYISVSEKDDIVTIHLREKGKKKAIRAKIDEMKLKKPEKWDGKWRVVMFDIPDEKKSARDYFKNKLDEFGFVQIQKSVYAHPYECKDEIDLMRELFEIKPYVNFLVANSFEHEHKYLSKFGLAKSK